MDVLGCTWMCVQADSFLFLPYLIVALCRWWLRSGRAVSGLTVDHLVVVLFLPSTFLPLHSCCRVVCVRWWMRVTCASHRVGDGFSRVLFISFPFSVCLVARLFPCLVTIHVLHGDLTRETNGEAQERNRGATKRRNGIRKRRAAAGRSHIWPSQSDMIFFALPCSSFHPSARSVVSCAKHTQTDTRWPCVSDLRLYYR